MSLSFDARLTGGLVVLAGAALAVAPETARRGGRPSVAAIRVLGITLALLGAAFVAFAGRL